jgi:hypothetical protein
VIYMKNIQVSDIKRKKRIYIYIENEQNGVL